MTVEDLEHLVGCNYLSVIDLSYNFLEDPAVIDVLARVLTLRVVNLIGNPVIKKIIQYRRNSVLKMKGLMYLDDRPVFPMERACVEAWAVGGLEAERQERLNWANREERKIRESASALLALKDKRKRDQMRAEMEKADSEAETVSPKDQGDGEPCQKRVCQSTTPSSIVETPVTDHSQIEKPITRGEGEPAEGDNEGKLVTGEGGHQTKDIPVDNANEAAHTEEKGKSGAEEYEECFSNESEGEDDYSLLGGNIFENAECVSESDSDENYATAKEGDWTVVVAPNTKDDNGTEVAIHGVNMEVNDGALGGVEKSWTENENSLQAIVNFPEVCVNDGLREINGSAELVTVEENAASLPEATVGMCISVTSNNDNFGSSSGGSSSFVGNGFGIDDSSLVDPVCERPAGDSVSSASKELAVNGGESMVNAIHKNGSGDGMHLECNETDRHTLASEMLCEELGSNSTVNGNTNEDINGMNVVVEVCSLENGSIHGVSCNMLQLQFADKEAVSAAEWETAEHFASSQNDPMVNILVNCEEVVGMATQHVTTETVAGCLTSEEAQSEMVKSAYSDISSDSSVEVIPDVAQTPVQFKIPEELTDTESDISADSVIKVASSAQDFTTKPRDVGGGDSNTPRSTYTAEEFSSDSSVEVIESGSIGYPVLVTAASTKHTTQVCKAKNAHIVEAVATSADKTNTLKLMTSNENSNNMKLIINADENSRTAQNDGTTASLTIQVEVEPINTSMNGICNSSTSSFSDIQDVFRAIKVPSTENVPIRDDGPIEHPCSQNLQTANTILDSEFSYEELRYLRRCDRTTTAALANAKPDVKENASDLSANSKSEIAEHNPSEPIKISDTTKFSPPTPPKMNRRSVSDSDVSEYIHNVILEVIHESFVDNKASKPCSTNGAKSKVDTCEENISNEQCTGDCSYVTKTVLDNIFTQKLADDLRQWDIGNNYCLDSAIDPEVKNEELKSSTDIEQLKQGCSIDNVNHGRIHFTVSDTNNDESTFANCEKNKDAEDERKAIDDTSDGVGAGFIISELPANSDKIQLVSQDDNILPTLSSNVKLESETQTLPVAATDDNPEDAMQLVQGSSKSSRLHSLMASATTQLRGIGELQSTINLGEGLSSAEVAEYLSNLILHDLVQEVIEEILQSQQDLTRNPKLLLYNTVDGSTHQMLHSPPSVPKLSASLSGMDDKFESGVTSENATSKLKSSPDHSKHSESRFSSSSAPTICVVQSTFEDNPGKKSKSCETSIGKKSVSFEDVAGSGDRTMTHKLSVKKKDDIPFICKSSSPVSELDICGSDRRLMASLPSVYQRRPQPTIKQHCSTLLNIVQDADNVEEIQLEEHTTLDSPKISSLWKKDAWNKSLPKKSPPFIEVLTETLADDIVDEEELE